MTPLPPGAIEHLLETLPPERQDPFPHLADLSTDELLRRRVEISVHLKRLEQERQAIDAELLEVFSDVELRFGVRAPGGIDGRAEDYIASGSWEMIRSLCSLLNASCSSETCRRNSLHEASEQHNDSSS